jgi:hypothetical protein
MSVTARIGLWGLLPNHMRVALAIASLVAVTAGTVLFQTDLSSEVPSEVTGGDVAAPDLTSKGLNDPSPSPSPVSVTGKDRSSAVISVPGEAGAKGSARSKRFPTFANYIYDVVGTEQGGALSRRTLPAEVTMTVDRSPGDGMAPPLEAGQLMFSLSLGPEHNESNVVGYGPKGITFTYESIDVTFNTTTQSSDVTLDPGVIQIPAVLKNGGHVEGTSTALGSDGDERRTEDWSVDIGGEEDVRVRDGTVQAWTVTLVRNSTPTSSERFSRTRKYWFDPKSGIWVKWDDTTNWSSGSGLSRVSYSSNYSATLDRIEPL